MFNGKRRKIILASVALLAVSLVSVVLASPDVHRYIFPSLPAHGNTPINTPMLWPVESNVELNQSTGFGSSFMVAGENASPMVVLAPGGSGTIPFTLSSPVNVSFTVSLSMYLGENATTPGVHFSISPANFTVNPGQHVASTLTVTVDQDAPSAYYSPTIAIQTNRQTSATGEPYVGGGPVDIPSLLIANSVPSCLYLVNEQEIPSNVLVMNKPSSGPATWPVFVPSPYLLPNVPTIHLSPGQTTDVLFGCFSIGSFNATGQPNAVEPDLLRMNVTAPKGLTAEFLGNPADIAWSGNANIYSVTVTANPSLGSGTYQVKGQASLGSHLFNWSLTYSVS